MGKVLIAYFSLTGKTEKMAEYIAEGVRFSGQQVVIKKISNIKSFNDLAGHDGYIFGSPTYHRDMAEPMKTFLFLAKKANLEGKLAGARRAGRTRMQGTSASGTDVRAGGAGC